MRETLDLIYAEYFRKLHEIRSDLSDDLRATAELQAWDECEEKLVAAWQVRGRMLH